MKQMIILLFVFLGSIQVLANQNEAKDMGKIFCFMNFKNSEAALAKKLSLVLVQFGKYDYMLSVYQRKTGGGHDLVLESPVRVYQTDVVARFRNTANRVHLTMFLDEADQAEFETPTLKGVFTCGFRN